MTSTTSLRATLQAIFSEGRTVSGDELISSIRGMDEETIYYLIGREVLLPTKRAANIAEYKFRVDSAKLELLEPPQGKAPTDEWHILVTYPPGMGFEKIKGVRPLYPDLCRLVIAAKREICIVNPFFDYGGRRRLLPYLVSAAKRGVRIRIVSRTQGLDMSDQLRSFVTPLLRIGANVETKTFGLRPDYSVHAKFIVGDEEMAYVGSANLTGRSLSRNVEAGVFVKGKGARVLKDFFDRLWKVARTL